MFNKEICFRCKKQWYESENIKVSWIRVHLEKWKNGWLWCPHDVDFNGSLVRGYIFLPKGKLPERCPFELEHTVTEKDHAK